jgi:hypothetical protein
LKSLPLCDTEENGAAFVRVGKRRDALPRMFPQIVFCLFGLDVGEIGIELMERG